jgi:hypothetical protein
MFNYKFEEDISGNFLHPNWNKVDIFDGPNNKTWKHCSVHIDSNHF